MLSAENAPIRVEPWPTEKILNVVVMIFSILIWSLLGFTLIGGIYALFIALFFFIAHVAFVAHIRGSGVRLSPDQFPDLYASVEDLSRRMGFEKVPEAYILQAGGVLNAFATRFLKSNLIILFSDLIEACGDDTAARDMIVAHELGHLKEGHLKWHWLQMPGLFIPFLGSALSRAREYTCDRYGLAGAGDKKSALTGLAILAAGAERGPKVNLNAMARQVEGLNTGWMTLGEWFASHPPLAKRLIALEQSLKPAGNYTQRGILRALGIIGLVYGVPTFLIMAAVLGMSIFQILQTRKHGSSKPPSLLFDSPFTQKAKTDVLSLAKFVEAERNTGAGLPADTDELYERWQKAYPSEKTPNDPFTGAHYHYAKDGMNNDFVIWSDGKNRITDDWDDTKNNDDILYFSSEHRK